VDHGDRVAGEQGVGAAGDAAVVADLMYPAVSVESGTDKLGEVTRGPSPA